MTIVDAFREPLTILERQRLKVVRDRKGFQFLAGLFFLLSFVCGFSALSHSRLLFFLSFIFFVSALTALFLRRRSAESYQFLFRELVTRSWFHAEFPEAYLAAPSGEVGDIEYFLVSHGCKTVLGFPVRGTEIEDRLYFERETSDSHIVVVQNRGRRALLLAKKRNEPGPSLEAQKELATYLRRFKRPRIDSSTEAFCAGVRLQERLFSAPVDSSALEASSYSHWSIDAKLILDPELRRLWLSVR